MTERRLPQYPPHSGFYTTLRRAVDAELAKIGRTRDSVSVYAKIALIGVVTAALYAAYLTLTGPIVLLLAVPFGLAIAAIGFNILHDGAHESVSRSRLVNRCAAFAGDLVGAAAYNWRWKHNLYHHSYPNVGGVDNDIELLPIARFGPFGKPLWFHRYQHIYMWVLYGFLPPKWIIDDLREVIRGRVGSMPMHRPRGADLVVFIAGKVSFFVAAFVIPAYVHGIWLTLAFYFLTAVTLGVTLSVVFQLAHVVEETSFHDHSTPDEWAVHQLTTTNNFATHSRLLHWCIGGLNFQVEHHLFPRISHAHYPRIAPVVRRVCEEFGVPYLAHETFFSALRSHYRMLKANGVAA